jgi:thymidine kinase
MHSTGLCKVLLCCATLSALPEITASADGQVTSSRNCNTRVSSSSLSATLGPENRAQIFGDRQRLLEVLRSRESRAKLCTPAAIDSYELFQESLAEELDVLWDIDIYAKKYKLTEKQHEEVLECSAKMEKYSDNFREWKNLIEKSKATLSTKP